MSFGCPLHILCRNRLTECGATATSYQRAVHAAIDGDVPEFDFLGDIKLSFDEEDNVPPKEVIDRWYALLGGSLLVALSGHPSTELQNGIHKLSRIPFWAELQIIPALKALTQNLGGLPSSPIHPIQSESGAVLYEAGQHWPWADIPATRAHAELGVLWCVLGMTTQDDTLIDAAAKIADWQQNTLDFDGTPFISLYNSEKEASLTLQLTFNYLLFRAVATARKCPKLAALAKQQVDHLNANCTTVPFIALLLEQWLDRNGAMPKEEPTELPERLVDTALSMAGIRTKERTAICTLAGGNTGLGVLRHGDAQIVNYGPQRLPLGECRYFGIESGMHDPHAGELHRDGHIFALKRSVRLVSAEKAHVSAALYQMTPPAGIWAQMKQRYCDDTLILDTRFFGYEPLDTLAFTFYGKGANCLLCHGQVIKPRSLQRYEGKPQPLSLQGHEGIINIIPDCGIASMQVIPLAGGENFWDADFLIACHIDPKKPECQWKISL